MTTELTVNLGDATPRRLLVAWVNSQDAWVRQLTAETILSRQTPGEEFLDVVYETFLLEKGLTEGDSPDIPSLRSAPLTPPKKKSWRAGSATADTH